MKFKIQSLPSLTIVILTCFVTPACGQDRPSVKECLAPGHKAASEQKFDEGIKIFIDCSEKHPNSSDAHFFLGMAYFHKKDIEKALLFRKYQYALDFKKTGLILF